MGTQVVELLSSSHIENGDCVNYVQHSQVRNMSKVMHCLFYFFSLFCLDVTEASSSAVGFETKVFSKG